MNYALNLQSLPIFLGTLQAYIFKATEFRFIVTYKKVYFDNIYPKNDKIIYNSNGIEIFEY